jgi:hypothetical protein
LFVRSWLSRSIGDHTIVTHAEQAFPAADGEGQNALQLVVLGPVRQIHQPGEQAEAAGIVGGGARTGLNKRPRDGVHFSKAGISKTFLRGERVCAQ